MIGANEIGRMLSSYARATVKRSLM
jgi:hypothetical protein